ncbi:odorant receptor 10-like isoform X2 [Lasioglossum baleicum]|uniref:odorant receptor 10-like isoform X2 n=1 Tax=Lasioglossum baleicum TaxID=434251 RepID=UPI003FCCD051
MQSDAQLRYLRLIGYFYNERSMHTNLTCLHMTMATLYGLLTFVCTEGTLTIVSTYVSGLLHIASNRIKNAVADAVTSDRMKPLDIRSAVDMHRQAIKQIKNYQDGVMMASLALVLVAVVSFGVNIYRLFVSITVVKETDNTMFNIQVVLAHLAIIFGSNYSGQIAMDTSVEILHATYDSLWYRLPPKMQKLILFMMIKAQAKLEISFAGLFTPCFEGFSTMMSTSFSYFTLLCSVH